MSREQIAILLGFGACCLAMYLLYKLHRAETVIETIADTIIMQADGKGKFIRDADGVIRWKERAR